MLLLAGEGISLIILLSRQPRMFFGRVKLRGNQAAGLPRTGDDSVVTTCWGLRI